MSRGENKTKHGDLDFDARFQYFGLLMNSSAFSAFRSRVLALCAHFKWEIVSGPTGMSDLEALCTRLDRMSIPPNDRLMLFLLGISGRYPFGVDWENWKGDFAVRGSSDLGTLVKHSRASIEAILSDAERHELFPVLDDHPIYDVSHTAEYPFVTGVQRVVRTVADRWKATGKPFHLFRFDEGVQAPLFFSDAESEIFFSRAKVRNSPIPVPTGLLSRYRKKHNKSLPYELARLIYVTLMIPFWFLSERSGFFRSCVRFVENFQKNFLESIRSDGGIFREKRVNAATRVPILYGKTIFIPEVNEKKKAIQFFLSVKENLRLTLGMIGYDLIPIYYPEHCLIQLEFMNYLRLLRVMDFISCISEAVRGEFSAFSANVPKKRPAVIEAHVLAGNLRKAEPSGDRDSKLVLTVGTLESRKNQKTFIRAARILKARGIEAEYVVVGNRGWLYDEIFTEYELAKSEGVNIRILSGLSDDELNRLYRDSAFTAFISQAEGYGLPVAESLNYRKPCVISDIPCLKEIAQSGGCLVVDQSDANAVASAFADLLTNREKRKALAASIQPSKLNTWETYGEELYAFVKANVGSSGLR